MAAAFARENVPMPNAAPAPPSLATLRAELDAADAELLRVLARRAEVVSRIAEAKALAGLPVLDRAREEAHLAAQCARGAELGLDVGVVRDVVSRVVRASREAQRASRAGLPPPFSVGIVGGTSGMGAFFARELRAAGLEVEVTGLDEGAPAVEVASRHELVLLAVPIEATADVARRVGPHVRAGGCLADVTSVKRAPIDAMLAATPASVEVVGTHPLFGPSVSCMDRLTVAVCEGRGSEWMGRLTSLFEGLGAEVVRVDAEEHDARMALAQAAIHAKSLALGHVLAAYPGGASALLTTATPQLRAEVALVARLAAAPPALLVGLLFENPHAPPAVNRLARELSRLSEALAARDRAFVARQVEALAVALGPALEGARATSEVLLEVAARS